MIVDRVMNSTQCFWIAKNLIFRFAEAFNNLININAPLNGRWIPFANSLVLFKNSTKTIFLIQFKAVVIEKKKIENRKQSYFNLVDIITSSPTNIYLYKFSCTNIRESC